MLRLTDGVALDPEVAPLCSALAAAGCETVYSCGAHLDALPPRDRAYVTFTCSDAGWMAQLRTFLRAPNGALEAHRRELRFDCFLGRYTLAVRAPAGGDARTALNVALREVTAWVRSRPPVRDTSTATCSVPDGRMPAIVPCTLTLDVPPEQCAWTGAPLVKNS